MPSLKAVSTAPKLGGKLIDLVGAGQYHMVVDMEGVEFLEYRGLGGLGGGRKRVREKEGERRRGGKKERRRKRGRRTGMTSGFTIDASVEEAVAATD